MDRRAHVYEVGDKLIVETWSRWVRRGVWTASGEIDVLDVRVSDVELGTTIQSALMRSRPTESPTPEAERITLRAAGIRSWPKFVKAAKSVTVGQNDNRVVITPSDRDGRGGGWAYRPENETLEAPHGDPAALGAVVRAGLAASG